MQMSDGTVSITRNVGPLSPPGEMMLIPQGAQELVVCAGVCAGRDKGKQGEET